MVLATEAGCSCRVLSDTVLLGVFDVRAHEYIFADNDYIYMIVYIHFMYCTYTINIYVYIYLYT